LFDRSYNSASTSNKKLTILSSFWYNYGIYQYVHMKNANGMHLFSSMHIVVAAAAAVV
jgi:hypothetical protein